MLQAIWSGSDRSIRWQAVISFELWAKAYILVALHSPDTAKAYQRDSRPSPWHRGFLMNLMEQRVASDKFRIAREWDSW